MRIYSISLICIILDQLTKILTRIYLPEGSTQPLLGYTICLTHIKNEGMIFGINPGYHTFFTVLSSFIALFLSYYLYKYKDLHGWQRFGLAMILGGAVGNLIDRIAYGKVVDFVDVDIPDIVLPAFQVWKFTFQGFFLPRWPIFNVADMSVSIGIGILLVSMYVHENRMDQRQDASSTR